MRRISALVLALILAASPFDAAWAQSVAGNSGASASSRVILPTPVVNASLSPLPSLAVPSLTAVTPGAYSLPSSVLPSAVSAVSAAAEAPRSSRASQPDPSARRPAPVPEGRAPAAVVQPKDEGDALFDGAEEKAEDSATEAIKELLRLRRDVQLDAREVMQENLGGDVGDGRLHRDLNRIAARLVRAAGLPKEAAQVFIGNSFLPNAFTTITGSEAAFIEEKASIAKPFRVANVFLSLGLLRAVENEEQLAFVIAHELNHNWKEHLKGFAGSHEMLGHFHEFEADLEALKLVAAAGYDPRKALDTLYTLDRAYEKLEKDYAMFSRKDKGEIAQTMERVRDVHPHADLRRANMLDHLDEALENYKPAPVPEKPLWMELRDSSKRPSALDRFEARARGAAAVGTTDERLHKLEAFAEREKSKRTLGADEKAVLEEAYRDILRSDPDYEGTRSLELSVTRLGAINAKNLKGSLVNRQLDLLLEGKNANLEDFLRGSAGLGSETRRAGALRLLGQVRTRAQLDAAYRALTRGAESLNLAPSQRGGMMGSPSGLDAKGVGQKTADRLWRATGRVLSAELGRAALPEEIIDELKAKLSPSWLRAYREHLHLLIIESAFERPERRSKEFTPSQLVARLRSLDENRRGPSDEKEAVALLITGLSDWGSRRYEAGKVEVKNDRFVHLYERYSVQGLSAPSERDFLDLFERFVDGAKPPPALIRILRREGLFDKYLLLALERLETRLLATRVPDLGDAVSRYTGKVQDLMRSSLHGVSDLAETARVAKLVWERAAQTHKLLQAKGGVNGLRGSKLGSSQLADNLLNAITVSVRVAVVRLNHSGARPAPEDLKALGEVVRSIESTLGLQSGIGVIMAHSGPLSAALAMPAGKKRDKAFVKAYRKAVGGAFQYVSDDQDSNRSWWQFWRKARPAVRGLRGHDLVSLLLLLADSRVPAATRLAAASFADNYHHFHDVQMGRTGEDALSLVGGHAVGRWLLETAVKRARAEGSLPELVAGLLAINDMQPGLHNPDVKDRASASDVLRRGAALVRRNEPLRTLARQEHPFRGVNARWGLDLMVALDKNEAWPKTLAERLDLLDLMNSTGEFSDALDERVVAEASSDPVAFQAWIKVDRERLKKWGGDRDTTIKTEMGEIPIPHAAPLRIVRNPALRVKLFDLLPESKLGERAPRRSLSETIKTWLELARAYRAARKYFSSEFLHGLRREGSLEGKFYQVLEEIDRVSREKAEKKRAEWDAGDFDADDRELDWKDRRWPAAWKEALPHEKEEMLKSWRRSYQGVLLAVVLRLYKAYATTQEPLLGLLLDNYPEPTRSRDELLERVIKARRLTPGALSFLEANKSHRQPNPVRVAEKQFMDQAITHLRRFKPADRVDLVLHMSGAVTLSPERLKELDRAFLKGDRKKLARDKAAIRSVTQLKGYLTMLHPKDRAMMVRGLFFGEDSLHQDPAEVRRLYETIVIKDRGLPAFVEETFRAYFRVLTNDEKAVLISSLAGATDLSQNMTGPEVVRVALKGMGVTGAKVAQVLATHRGLLPEEYAVALEGFKDRAQDMPKMRAFELMKERLEKLADDKGKPREVALDELDALAEQAIPEESPAMRLRMAKQVRYILAEEGRQVARLDYLGPELGSGSIKVVYKATLADGRVWVVKLRAPGAMHRTKREFEIIESLVGDLEKSGTLDLPGVRQLIEEVRGLVRAEMDFRDEAAKEIGVRDRAKARPWYARLLVGPVPHVPAPHPVYQGEDILVEEFVPVKRFADLPRWSLFGPSKRSIARRAVDEGTYALVHDEWLEPDAHTGNRYARKGWLDRLITRLVIIDLGQGQPSPVARLKPLMRAGLALESEDIDGAAAKLMDTLEIDPATEAKVRAAVAAGLARRPKEGIVERLMDGYLEAEKSGALVKPEYAALQKGFLIYGGYAEWLPKNGLYASLERAATARVLRDRTIPLSRLLKIGLKRLFFGRASVRAEMEELIEKL